MKDHCYDEGTIQDFLDGELASDRLEQVARHVAACDACAFMLQEAEEESSFAFAALDTEFNTLVPTERIRTNLYQAISEIEKPKASIWEKLFSFGSIFSNPSIAAFAGLIVVAGMFAIVWSFRTQETAAPEVARAENKQPTVNIPNPTVTTPSQTDISNPPVVSQTAPQYVADNNKSRSAAPVYQKAVYKPSAKNVNNPSNNSGGVAPAETELLPGEDTYIKTIATLKKTVDGSKDEVLRPSARVAFEKDMAMVNDSIAKMKKEVRKNPKNQAAKEVLRNSYQNKIDLLNSVAERNELMALRDDD